MEAAAAAAMTVAAVAAAMTAVAAAAAMTTVAAARIEDSSEDSGGECGGGEQLSEVTRSMLPSV